MIVNTRNGKVEGYYSEGIYEFKGIPYAKSKRFHKATEYYWDGIWEAKEYGPCAMQILENKIIGDEDCLNLNIITPSIEKNLPVLVEIHGGAFQAGSNQSMIKSLSLKKKAFVHVAINYRLGVLGFLYLGNQLGETYQNTGNLGILDQILALQWVKKNISCFGGNPEEITLFGNSAGGKSVGALMVSPYSKDLFRQVILSSGALQAIRRIDTAEKLSRDYLEQLRIKDIIELVDIDVTILLKAQDDWCNKSESTCFFGPVDDGEVIRHNWQAEVCSESGWKGRAIIGSNRHECIGLKERESFMEDVKDIISDLFGEYACHAETTYNQLSTKKELSRDEKKDLWVKIISDYMYRTHSKRLVDMLTNRNQRVWMYSFEFAPADHALDIRILNGDYENEHLDMTLLEKDEIAKIREIMEEFYCQFIVGKDPNGGVVPLWNSYSELASNTLIIDRNPRVISSQYGEYLQDFPFVSIL